MTWINSQYTFQAARSLGRAFYELTLSNWANVSVGADTNSIIFPAVGQPPLSGVYGAMISSNSKWDRCLLRYNTSATQQGISAGGAPTPLNMFMPLSVEAPLIFPMPADIFIEPYRTASYVLPGQTGNTAVSWGAAYLKPASAANSTFTNTANTMDTEALLSLILFLQPPGQATTSRAPYVYNWTHLFVGDGNESTPAAPALIAGRKHVRGIIRPITATGTWTLRIGSLISIPVSALAGIPLMETTAATTAGFDATLLPVFEFDLDVDETDWLQFHATRTGGAVGNANFQIMFVAYD